MEPAVFRPVQRGQGPQLLLGGLGGLAVGAAAGVPFPLGPIFGAIAAAIASAARQVSGVRLLASEERLEVRGRAAPFSARWEELRLGFGLTAREGDGDYQRYAVLADPAGNSVAFGAFGGQGPCRPVRGALGREVEVLDLEAAAVLLAILVQRIPAWQVLPEWLLDPAVPPPLDAPPDGPAAAAGEGAAAAPGARSTQRMGLLALLAKLGGKAFGLLGKFGAGAAKAVQGTNVAMAAASAASFAIFLRWEMAVLLVVQLFVHEYGHAHAMRRSGMRVKGTYFLPFLGAMTVPDGAYTSRRQQAYVALSGPLWGGAFTLAPLAAWWATGSPFWITVASGWALINLVNLLPIKPLDGGRALHAFATSFSSRLGVAVGLLGLAGAVALGVVMGFSIVWLVAAIGAMELVGESRFTAGGRALALLPAPARFGPAHYRHLRAVLGPPAGRFDELAFGRELAQMQQAVRVAPMEGRQILGWGLLYAGLAGALLALVYFTSHLPGAGVAAQVLT